MAQTLFNATGLNADNTDAVKDAGSAISGVKWVNVTENKVVVTHDDTFDATAFTSAVEKAGVSLSQA